MFLVRVSFLVFSPSLPPSPLLHPFSRDSFSFHQSTLMPWMPLPGEAAGAAPPMGDEQQRAAANEWVRNLMQYLGRQPDGEEQGDAEDASSDEDD